jgi:DNA-binding response OmpR family regulator
MENRKMADEILIVDENPGVQRALKRFLTQNGYSVVTTNNVQSAMSLIGQSTPSLMILDIKMPRIDGIELIHLLRENSYPFPVIVMTAYPTFFTREEALKNGVSAYVTKPFDPEEILEYICQLQTCGKAYGN